MIVKILPGFALIFIVSRFVLWRKFYDRFAFIKKETISKLDAADKP